MSPLAFAEFSAARRSRDPAIRFTRALNFEASVVRTLLQPVRLLAPLHGSDRALPSQRKLLGQSIERTELIERALVF